nr:hypothetical protein [Tanacetum cinerariifolium]
MKSSKRPQARVIIKDTPGVSVSKKKSQEKGKRSKGIEILSDVALTKAAQLKEATKRSKKYLHISQASVLGDGTDFESGVPDEQQRKTSSTDEGIGTKPRDPDEPKYDSDSEKESWGDSGEEDDDDDEDDFEDDDDNKSNDDDNNDNDNKGNDDDDDDLNDDDYMNDDDDKTDSDRTESGKINILDLSQSSIKEHEEEEEKYVDDEEKMEEDEDDDVTKELYEDVNVNFGNKDANMTNADQGGADEHNISQELGFEQVVEDDHVTLTAVHDTQKTKGPMQSSSVSSDFKSKHLNLKNVSPANNEIASLMDTTVHHEEPRIQTSSLYTVPVTIILDVPSTFTMTISPPPPFFNPLQQHATPTTTPTTSKETPLFPALLDFSSVF